MTDGQEMIRLDGIGKIYQRHCLPLPARESARALTVPEHLRYARIGRVWQNPATGTCSDLTILENMALADCGPGDGKPASSGKRGAKCRRFGLTAGPL